MDLRLYKKYILICEWYMKIERISDNDFRPSEG